MITIVQGVVLGVGARLPLVAGYGGLGGATPPPTPTQRGNIAYNQIRTTDRQGSGVQFQMAGAGSKIVGHTLIYDANGNAIDGGAPSGSGTVTSVDLTMPAEFSVSGNPITTSGTLAVTKATQSANLVYAGPTTGAAAAPTFRAVVAADIPSGIVSKISYGTIAAFIATPPSSPIAGDTYRCSDSAYEFIYSGSAWVARYWGVPVTLPVTGSFAWQNQGTSTVSTADGSLVMTSTGTGGDQIRFYGVTLPATPWTCVAAFVPSHGQYVGGEGFYVEGLCLTDGTKYRSFWVAYTPTTTATASSTPSLNAQGYDNNTTFNAGQNIILRNLVGCPLLWLKITDDGTNKKFYVSPTDGNYVQIGSETHTNFLTPTKVGIVMNLYGASVNGLVIPSMPCVSWKVT